MMWGCFPQEWSQDCTLSSILRSHLSEFAFAVWSFYETVSCSMTWAGFRKRRVNDISHCHQLITVCLSRSGSGSLRPPWFPRRMQTADHFSRCSRYKTSSNGLPLFKGWPGTAGWNTGCLSGCLCESPGKSGSMQKAWVRSVAALVAPPPR